MMTVKECIEQLAVNNPNEWKHEWGETPRQAAIRLLLTLLPDHEPDTKTLPPLVEVNEVWGREVAGNDHRH